MEIRDFLYHFTDILFSEIVKDTILIENWEESDFDYRYAEYITIFQNMMEACLTKGSPDEVIMSRLTTSRVKVINLFNQKMKENFIAQIASTGIEDPVEAENLMPPGLFKDDTIRADVLNIFRTFEEETLKGERREVS
jgi:hypothetical protein